MKYNSPFLSEFQRDNLRGLFQLKIMAVIIIILILTIGALCIIRIDTVCKQQIDTLDQLNYIRQDLELQDENADAISEAVPADPVSSITLTPDERELVCRVVAAEARGGDIQQMEAVAQVIRDRSNSWGMSITDVITADGQFAKPYQGEISDEIYLSVANVFDGQISVLEVPTTHFHADSVDPYWTANKECRGSLGRMIFWE